MPTDEPPKLPFLTEALHLRGRLRKLYLTLPPDSHRHTPEYRRVVLEVRVLSDRLRELLLKKEPPR